MKLWNACCTGDSDFIQNLSPDLPFIDGLLNMKNHPVFVSRLLTGAIIARIVILYISHTCYMQGPFTPLVIAVQYGHKQVVDCLLQKGAKPNAPTEVCTAALYIIMLHVL